MLSCLLSAVCNIIHNPIALGLKGSAFTNHCGSISNDKGGTMD
jgi:hypothetical protein